MKIGNKDFDIEHHTYIMGILNVTPDSFSDGGNWDNLDAAIKHTEDMINDGAAIIDVGGESTRLGYTRISDQEELDRVCPVIEAITKRFDVPVSVDTYKSGVASVALDTGAVILNDIWGFKADENMAKVVAEKDAWCVLMHNKEEAVYNDFVEDMVSELAESVKMAKAAGIKDEKIIVDPGVGFGKTLEHNLLAIKHVDALEKLGYPILLATSRKSVIGLTLDLPKDERVEGTLATTAVGVMKHCGFVRVHDVKENKRFIDMLEAVLKA